MINIDDINKIDEKKKRIRKEIYTKIFEQFSSKIKQSVEFGNKQVFLVIPLFLIGYPVFDRSMAARYVARQLTLAGFIVHMVSEFDLYVSWYVPKKKKVKEVAEDEDFPNLMNLKKIANKYRKSA